MAYKRINGRIDINDAIETKQIVFNEDEPQGTRANKFWFNDYGWLYKDVDNEYDTYEDYAELISYEIAKALGINAAEYDLATYNGNRGVITKSVVNHEDEIVSGTNLLKTVYNEYFIPKLLLYDNFVGLCDTFNISSIDDFKSEEDKDEFFRLLVANYNQSCNNSREFIRELPKEGRENLFNYCVNLPDYYAVDFINFKNGVIHSNNLYDIWSAVEIYCNISDYKIDTSAFMRNLIDLFIFDIITSQGDRHADNWSIIIDNNTQEVTLAGLYDNSNALSLNRKKAIVNIGNYLNRLKTEPLPQKRNGILRQLKNTIDHAFSALKVNDTDVINRNKNDILLENFLRDSSQEFVDRLEECVNILDNEEIVTKMFQNIENKTGEPIPEMVKNVARGVLNYNIQRIKEIMETKKGMKL